MSSEKDMPESRETDSSIGSEHQGEPDPEDQQPRSYREVEISAESLQIITQLPLANFVSYVPYDSELQMPDIMRLMKADLSEPYSIYTYRYFIHNWPRLCILACCDERYVGAIVCKLELHHFTTRRGYIAMLAVDKEYRKRKIGARSRAHIYDRNIYLDRAPVCLVLVPDRLLLEHSDSAWELFMFM